MSKRIKMLLSCLFLMVGMAMAQTKNRYEQKFLNFMQYSDDNRCSAEQHP